MYDLITNRDDSDLVPAKIPDMSEMTDRRLLATSHPVIDLGTTIVPAGGSFWYGIISLLPNRRDGVAERRLVIWVALPLFRQQIREGASRAANVCPSSIIIE